MLSHSHQKGGAQTVDKLISCTVKRIINTVENILRTDKALIISWPYQCNCTNIDLSKTALSLALHHHTCLPCQREVDWRQGTNCCFVAFYLWYAHPFYATNSSAAKTEGLPYCLTRSRQPFSKPHYPSQIAITLAFKWTLRKCYLAKKNYR